MSDHYTKTLQVLNGFKEEREKNRSTGMVKMTIESFVPSKWRFVDMETGDVWKWDPVMGEYKQDNSDCIVIKQLYGD